GSTPVSSDPRGTLSPGEVCGRFRREGSKSSGLGAPRVPSQSETCSLLLGRDGPGGPIEGLCRDPAPGAEKRVLRGIWAVQRRSASGHAQTFANWTSRPFLRYPEQTYS